MNALVFLVVRSERELQAHLDQFRRYEDEVKPGPPALQPEQKNCEQVSFRLQSQTSCDCCD